MNERELVLDVLAILKSHVTDPFLMGQIARAEDDIEPPDYVAQIIEFADRYGQPLAPWQRDALRRLWDTSSTTGPGLRDGIRERLSPCPTDSGDPVEDRNLPTAPPEVGDDPAGSDGSTATIGAAVGTGESSAPSSWSFIVGAHHDVHADRSRTIGIEDHSEFPVGEWTRLYVPTARLVDCCEAIDALFDSEAHADDPPAPSAITYRSTGRGAYDVIENRAEGPDRVLAMVQFTEGVRGRVAALDRFADALARVAREPL